MVAHLVNNESLVPLHALLTIHCVVFFKWRDMVDLRLPVGCWPPRTSKMSLFKSTVRHEAEVANHTSSADKRRSTFFISGGTTDDRKRVL